MNIKEFNELEIGDIVQHVESGTGYVVKEKIDDGYIVTRTLTIFHADEWKKVPNMDFWAI